MQGYLLQLTLFGNFNFDGANNAAVGLTAGIILFSIWEQSPDSAHILDHSVGQKDQLRKFSLKQMSYANKSNLLKLIVNIRKQVLLLASGKLFCIEIYYRAIKLRDSYDLEISPAIKTEFAYLNLCS